MNYHDDITWLPKTALNVFCDNPYDFYCQYIAKTVAKKKPTGDMITGSVLHAVMLEGKKIDDLIGVYPDSCLKSDKTINGKPAAKHRAENPGRYWMKEPERDRINATYLRLKDTPISEAINACSKFEHEWRAKLYGKNCKCRTDIAGDMGDYWDIWDLKFTDNIAGFRKSSRALRYWLQDAHYSQVVAANVGKPVRFTFLVAETVAPYRVRIHQYDEIKREAAAKTHKAKILAFLACESSGVWPDQYDRFLPLDEYDVGESSDVLWDDEALEAMNESVDETEVMEDMPF